MKAKIDSTETKNFNGDYFNGIRVVVNMTAKEALGLIEKLAQCLHDNIFEGPYVHLDETSIITSLRDKSKNFSIHGNGEIRFVVNK